MKLEFKVYGSLCSMQKFAINGIDAESSDFGEQGDTSPETADDYCCGCMEFTPRPPSEEILKKYNISTDEYNEVSEKLKEGLSFGSCVLCS